jgi:hypothetical protein
MSTEQPLALRLADHLEQFRSFPSDLEAAAELRRLHAENEFLKQALHMEEAISFRRQLQEVHAENEALRQAPEALETFERAGLAKLQTVDAIEALRERLK